jgi:hypothetical protein
MVKPIPTLVAMSPPRTKVSEPDVHHMGLRALTVVTSVALLLHAALASPQTMQSDARQPTATLNGQVTDETGAALPGANVTLKSDDSTATVEAVSGADGRFSLADVPAGSFRLTVSAADFAAQTLSGVLAPGETSLLPPVRLTLYVGTVRVDVTPAQAEIAEQQIKQQERQRVLSVFPNFRVSYLPDAAPLNSRQKFQLTWKTVSDPTRFLSVGVIAGIQQARNDHSGFGSGPEGYARRYTALYATILTGSLISNVVMPIVFQQDPRYFYKGTGSTSSRMGYAISRAVVRKGDNGRWQPDYSRILGHLAAGAISNFYYPAADRRGIGLTLGNAALGIGGAAAGNLMQEFVLRRLTTHAHEAR